MTRTSLLLATLLVAAGTARAADLRVCGDPGNLPFSNEKGEGIENKIVEVIARDLGSRVTYFWWPHQMGLVKRVLNSGRCDVLVGIPKGWDPVRWTRPYYRAGYVIAARRDRGLAIRTLDDPRLRTLRVGVVANTPPHAALGQRGIVGENVAAYTPWYDSQFHPDLGPSAVMEDLLAGRIDVALVWGPIAGYYAKRRAPAALEVMPLEAEPGSGLRFAFDISMGVRKDDAALQARLDEALARSQGEITQILEDYGVPLLPVGGGR